MDGRSQSFIIQTCLSIFNGLFLFNPEVSGGALMNGRSQSFLFKKHSYLLDFTRLFLNRVRDSSGNPGMQ